MAARPIGVYQGQFGCIQLNNGTEARANDILTYDAAANITLAAIGGKITNGGGLNSDAILTFDSDVSSKIDAVTESGRLKVSTNVAGTSGVLYNSNTADNTASASVAIQPLVNGRFVTIFGKVTAFATVTGDVYFNLFISNDNITYYRSGFGSIVVNSANAVQDFSVELQTSAPYLRLECSAIVTAQVFYAMRS